MLNLVDRRRITHKTHKHTHTHKYIYTSGTIIEISEGGAAKGQWATIEAYDGYNTLAMFRKWNRPECYPSTGEP